MEMWMQFYVMPWTSLGVVLNLYYTSYICVLRWFSARRYYIQGVESGKGVYKDINELRNGMITDYNFR